VVVLLSRQRNWQRKKKEEGLCVQCGKELFTAHLCKACRDKLLVLARGRTGWKGRVYKTKYSGQEVPNVA
jgi:hypothetical protein